MRCSVSSAARASLVCMSRQNAQPLSCEARIRISSRSSGSTLASCAAETAAPCRDPIAAETSGVIFLRATRDTELLFVMGKTLSGKRKKPTTFKKKNDLRRLRLPPHRRAPLPRAVGASILRPARRAPSAPNQDEHPVAQGVDGFLEGRLDVQPEQGLGVRRPEIEP